MKTPQIWLCDLTYTQQSISNDTVPAAIGGIATTILKFNPKTIIKLFKYPDKLSKELEKIDNPLYRPDIISFSNYSWNINRSWQE